MVATCTFVDSRTDVRTVARQSARDAGLPECQRDVFLDDEQDASYVRQQLTGLIARAPPRLRDRYRASAPQTLGAGGSPAAIGGRGIELVPVDWSKTKE